MKQKKSQYYDDIAEDYFSGPHTNHPFSHLLSLLPDDGDDCDDFVNIDDILPSIAGPSTSTTPLRALPESRGLKGGTN